MLATPERTSADHFVWKRSTGDRVLCTLEGFCFVLFFDSCKTSSNVAFHHYLPGVDSKFHFICYYHECEVECLVHFVITFFHNFVAVKIKETQCRKKNFECLK